jgi:hypothetical protein
LSEGEPNRFVAGKSKAAQLPSRVGVDAEPFI